MQLSNIIQACGIHSADTSERAVSIFLGSLRFVLDRHENTQKAEVPQMLDQAAGRSRASGALQALTVGLPSSAPAAGAFRAAVHERRHVRCRSPAVDLRPSASPQDRARSEHSSRVHAWPSEGGAEQCRCALIFEVDGAVTDLQMDGHREAFNK